MEDKFGIGEGITSASYYLHKFIMINRVTHLIGRALRESGQALDRTALRIAADEIFQETYTRHRPEMTLYGKVRYG